VSVDGSWTEGLDPTAGLPFPDFTTAAHAVLRLLSDRLTLHLWMVTRAAGGDQVVLAAENSPGSGYDVAAGRVLPWDGSLCAVMAAGHGPTVAPRAVDIPAYAAADNRRQTPIEAYIGVPLRQPDGTLFGTLCAFDPESQPEALRQSEQLVVLQAELLATVLAFDLDRERQRRRAERAETEATRDALTGLPNRRAWDRIVAAEEVRTRRYAHPGCVLMIDLNDLKLINDSHGHAAGDQLLRRCANVLMGTARDSDYVARLGGDEFGVLAVKTDGQGGQAQVARLREALRQAGINAAIGLGVRDFAASFATAFEQADHGMYLDKTSQRKD